jgi:hypothetical protein
VIKRGNCKLIFGMNLGCGLEESDPTMFYAVSAAALQLG